MCNKQYFNAGDNSKIFIVECYYKSTKKGDNPHRQLFFVSKASSVLNTLKRGNKNLEKGERGRAEF